LPLWQELIPAILARPLTGYGFGAFWSPDRILALADSQGWTISHAHSDYLDLVLALGVPGLLAYVATLLTGIGAALRRARTAAISASDSAGPLLAIAGWLVFLAIGGLTEQVGLQPSLPVFCVLCGLVHLSCRDDSAPSPAAFPGGLHP
jgi:O-antigen ligase